MPKTILHVLSQRPAQTGSGVTLEATVRLAAEAGWHQAVVIGVPASDPHPIVANLPARQIFPLCFETDELPYPLPGMSDVMPYRSTRFSEMTPQALDAYRAAWRRHLAHVLCEVDVQLVHAHHIWLVSALLRDVAPGLPIVGQCHATGLRQMELCPHLADEVVRGCSRIDRFVVQHQGHADSLVNRLAISPERVRVVGAGYRDDLFYQADNPHKEQCALVYVGKYSAAKGLPWLLDAVERLSKKRPALRLHVAGAGSGPEADALHLRMDALSPLVQRHGQLDQPQLADLMRRCRLCVLPSMYEGVPLVLVEALACGCHLVSTSLPGVINELQPSLGKHLDLVALPRMRTIDDPDPQDLPAFVERLTAALDAALDRPLPKNTAETLAPFTWGAVYQRIEASWTAATDSR